MRLPTLTAPRLLVAIGIVAMVGFALALPSLLDGESASKTAAVVIGDERKPREEAGAGRNESSRDRDRGRPNRADDALAPESSPEPAPSPAEAPAVAAAPAAAPVEEVVDDGLEDPSDEGMDD